MAHPCATDPELWFGYPDDDGSDGAAKARAYERSATQARIQCLRRDTELDILHREEAMARYWRAVAARDYSIANVTAGQAAGLVNAVLPAADVITGMAQQAARTLTAMRAV